tara:strand:- start:624 stop:866 length:243 start_codon:yes stop_codon:yes gene_type:complete
MTKEIIKPTPHRGARICWTNIRPLPANTVGKTNFSFTEPVVRHFEGEPMVSEEDAKPKKVVKVKCNADGIPKIKWFDQKI